MIIKEINIDLKNDEKVDFNHFYGATGYANADYTYTPALKRMYDMYDTYKGYPKYMRLHNIMTLHGKGDKYILEGVSDYGNPFEMGRVEVDTVVLRDNSGTLIYNWEYVDKVYDIIINHGMKPIVEAVYIPTSIRKSREEYYIPGDYKEFYQVIQSFVNHWIDRYGLEEVKTWYFEIFNEPDMHISFVKNAYAFNALYDYFEAAIHDINSDLIVGGPAVKQWDDAICVFEQFVEHINNGLNYVSGKFGTRIDFISIHSKGGYPTINGPDFNYMFDPIRKFASILEKYPKMKDVPFINDESDIVWEGNSGVKEKSWLNFRNTEYAAGFTCKMIDKYCQIVVDELKLNLDMVDSDNSHVTWEKSLFSGNRSQLSTFSNVPSTNLFKKPVFNAFSLLGMLGNKRIKINTNDIEFGEKYGTLCTELDNKQGYSIMLWNFEDGLEKDVNERLLNLNLKNLENGEYYIKHYRIDENHSNSYNIWKNLNKKINLTNDEMDQIRDKDDLELFEDIQEIEIVNGNISKDFTLAMHSVSLLVLINKNKSIVDKEELSIKAVYDNSEEAHDIKHVFIKWNYSESILFKNYEIYKEVDGVQTLLSNKVFCSYYYDLNIKQGDKIKYFVKVHYLDNYFTQEFESNVIEII